MMVDDEFPKVYLTKRNLLTLLAKLERDSQGHESSCAIIKYKNPDVAAYQQTMDGIMVIGVHDEDYYLAQQRSAGIVHPAEEPFVTVPSTGVGEDQTDL